ncbi:helix-turn-helix transcriptional regulator [Pseudovibrio sp. SPO723]|uniref:helix-turn-helix domain-containing protein n=1 Tax=Nesiotobacter zosterae TaxID=392721 RepID=UPI0029C34C88|nr:helix-turn-helix transcriptional regulator [Pseudovibrio sp. SPO723]MDX5592599.1 helix-turn-helix transcriptional regulator [Pseudovibrio sp. SPO723]
MLTGRQLAAARTLAGLKQSDLAKGCGVSVPTIKRYESTKGVIQGNYQTIQSISDVLRENGVALISAGAVSHGAGACFIESEQVGNED